MHPGITMEKSAAGGAEMEQIALYTIAYKGLKSGSYEYDFQVDDVLFKLYSLLNILT